MTTHASRVSNAIPSVIELSASEDAAGNRAGQISRDDVLQYVHEMCVTLSYMSITYRCERLADLLCAAANEAEQGIAGGDRAPPIADPVGHSASRNTQGDEMGTVMLKPTSK